MHTCVATCKPRIGFQRKFTISIKIFFSSPPPPPISGLPVFLARILLRDPPWVSLNPPFRVQASIKHNNSARIFVFPLTRFGSRDSSLLLFPAFSFHSIHSILVLCTASIYFFLITNQQYYRTASGFSKSFFTKFSSGHLWGHTHSWLSEYQPHEYRNNSARI